LKRKRMLFAFHWELSNEKVLHPAPWVWTIHYLSHSSPFKKKFRVTLALTF
jgi:hypothetical protein